MPPARELFRPRTASDAVEITIAPGESEQIVELDARKWPARRRRLTPTGRLEVDPDRGRQDTGHPAPGESGAFVSGQVIHVNGGHYMY